MRSSGTSCDVEVAQLDAEHRSGLGLDLGPGRQCHRSSALSSSLPVATGPAGPRSSSYSRRNTWCEGCDVYVWFWSTNGVRLVGCARAMSSVIAENAVGAGARLVARVSTMNCRSDRHLVAGAGNAVRAERDQRIVRLQRDEHRAAAALGDQIEAVIEELAEEREPGVEAGRQALVRRRVRDGQRHAGRDGDIVQVQERADWVMQKRRSGRSAIAEGFRPALTKACTAAGLVMVWSTIRLEIDARIRVDHACRPIVVWYVPNVSVRVAEDRIQQAREELVGGAENLLGPGTRLLNDPSTVRSPKATNEFGSRVVRSAPAACCFRNQDLLEDELEIRLDQSEP